MRQDRSVAKSKTSRVKQAAAIRTPRGVVRTGSSRASQGRIADVVYPVLPAETNDTPPPGGDVRQGGGRSSGKPDDRHLALQGALVGGSMRLVFRHAGQRTDLVEIGFEESFFGKSVQRLAHGGVVVRGA